MLDGVCLDKLLLFEIEVISFVLHLLVMMNLQQRSVFIHIICFCVTGSAVASTSTSSNIYGPLDITLLGPDVVTVGIPASFFCLSQCSPVCVYSITADGRRADTDEITIIIRERLNSTTTVTCTALNNITRHASTTHKTLQILQGPQNVSISGPAFLPVDRSQSFQCSAVCWPSCNYSWTSNGLPLSASGNQLVVTPSAAVTIETLVCTAANSVTGIFASAVRKLYVTDGPLYTIIRGPDRIQLHSSTTFECLSRCRPSCNYTWTAENQSQPGKMIDVTVESWRESLTLTCRATNIITNMTEVTHKTLRVTENTAAPLKINLMMSAFVIVLSLHFN